MNKKCAKCDKTVYPVEELKCLEKIWHKTCFKCQVCCMTLSMKNYKGFEKLPYCGAHVPKAKATVVADTPENKRLAENSKVQSNVKYHAEFEASKGKFTQIADDPETLRIKANTDVISNITYHDVKGHKDDMEKKRSLQGGGENVRTAEELKAAAEPVKAANQEHGRASQDHSSRMSQDYGREQPEQTRMSQDQGYNMSTSQSQPQQRSMSSSYSSGSNASSRSNTAMSNSYNNARNQPPPYANPPQQQQAYQQQQQLQQQQFHQQQQQQRQQQQHMQMQRQQQLQQQQLQQQHLHQQQLHQQQLQQQQLHQQQLHQQQLLQQQQQQQQQQMRKMAEHSHKMGHQGQVPGGGSYGMKNQQPHGHPASQSQYQDKRIISNSHPQQQHYQQGGRVQPQQNSAPHSRQSNRCYQAMYDYEAQDSDEVSFRDGDIIIDAVFIDEGWMTGTVHRTGKSGMLPANYVEPVNL